MNDDHIVMFNHDYSKLRGQRSGFLCYATIFHVGEKFPEEAYQYDTDGLWEFKPNTDYIQLVFLGEKEIPFTGTSISTTSERSSSSWFTQSKSKKRKPKWT